MKTLTILSALVAALILSGCGSVVQGVVRDKPTGNPVASANVTIDDETAITNAMGVYEVNVSVKPSSVLSVNAPGYFIYTESVGDRLIHDIDLVPRK
jgi:uncharacterized protein YceK